MAKNYLNKEAFAEFRVAQAAKERVCHIMSGLEEIHFYDTNVDSQAIKGILDLFNKRDEQAARLAKLAFCAPKEEA